MGFSDMPRPGAGGDFPWLRWEAGEVKKIMIVGDPIALEYEDARFGPRRSVLVCVFDFEAKTPAKWEMSLTTSAALAEMEQRSGSLTLPLRVKRVGRDKQTVYDIEEIDDPKIVAWAQSQCEMVEEWPDLEEVRAYKEGRPQSTDAPHHALDDEDIPF